MTQEDQDQSRKPIIVGVVVVLLITTITFFAFSSNGKQNKVESDVHTETQLLQADQKTNSAEADAKTNSQNEPIVTQQPQPTAGQQLQPTTEPTSSERDTKQEAHYLFYGETCPHCHDTMDWMKENNISQKLVVVKKEVYSNQENSKQLSMAAANCGEGRAGVPFLYTPEQECFIGTPDILKYFSSKLGIPSS